MQLNLFTSNDKFRSEIYIVIKLLENGLETLQIKKSDFTKKQLRSYLDHLSNGTVLPDFALDVDGLLRVSREVLEGEVDGEGIEQNVHFA